MLARSVKIFIFLAIILVIPQTGVRSESGTVPLQVIANLNIYQSFGKTNYGFYKIDIDSRDRNLIRIPLAADLMNARISPDGRYVLGEKFDMANFTEDLFLVDLIDRKVHQLTMTPEKGVFHTGKPSGKFTKYGFSKDSRFAVIMFPNGADLTTSPNAPPLMSKDVYGKDKILAFIDLDNLHNSGNTTSITLIDAIDYPVFSPSGHRFMVPINRINSDNIKAMVYEIGTDDNGKLSFFGYELPYRNIRQGSFVTENLLYIFNNSELILYDLVGSRVKKINDFYDINLMGSGYPPPQMPGFPDFSSGELSFRGDNYAFMMRTQRRSSPGSNYNSLSIFGDYEFHDDDQNLAVVRGNCNNPGLDYIEVPRLPDSIYEDYLLYHHLYLPENTDDIAILFSSGWSNQVFRMVDFKKSRVSRPIPGFFLGMTKDKKGMIYLKCGNETCSPYKYNCNFTWDRLKIDGKIEGIKVNSLYYRDIETGTERLLIEEPSHTAEAFLIQ